MSSLGPALRRGFTLSLPTYDKFMLPLLEMVSDNHEHTQSDAIERMVVVFGPSEDDRKQMLPSQADFVLGNRIRWACFYLRKALLLETGTKYLSKNLLFVRERDVA